MRHGQFYDQQRPMRVGGAAQTIPVVPAVPVVRPSPMTIARFLRTVRLLNGDEEPDPNGPLAEVWDWLRHLARE